jgi:hypothetical protein
MPGLLDMLNAQLNTAGSGNTYPLTSFLQGTPQAGSPTSLMGLMQNLWGVKQPAPTPPYDDANFFNLPFQSSPEQLARMQQLAQIFPQSRNVIDRTTPMGQMESYPRPLPLQQMGQGLQGALVANSAWPMPARGPMMRYGGQ